MKIYRGIDVSSYQGLIDWKKVKAAGIEFAILKVARKDMTPDHQFEKNWAGCLAAGVPVQGVYHYTYAADIDKAASDAAKILKILGPDRHPFVWLDYEDKSLPTDRRLQILSIRLEMSSQREDVNLGFILVWPIMTDILIK